MEHLMVPARLYARLGDAGSEGLVEMFGQYHQFATDRFERRLTEETAALRVEMHQGFGALRQEMGAMRVEWLKWSFLFWIGHVAVTVSIITYMVS